MRWFETTNFNFIRAKKVTYVISSVLIVISIAAIFGLGLNYGIDFKGGKEYVFEFDKSVDVLEMRSILLEPLGSAPELKLFGSDREILIRTDAEGNITEVQDVIFNTLQGIYPDHTISVENPATISARFAEDLKQGALYSIIFSLAVIFLYILIRFKSWYYSLGAIAALAHDVVIVLGVFTIMAEVVSFDLSIDQAIVGAFLAIIGYSLNDTVVVFDRIRENSNLHKGMDFVSMVNKSLNDTLSRTVITSITTLFVVIVLFIFGGVVLKGFSFALLIGIVLGTYSSLFVASTLVVEFEAGTTKS